MPGLIKSAMESAAAKAQQTEALSMDAGQYGMLGVWKTWCRDLILVKTGAPAGLLINSDFSDKLKNSAKNSTIEQLIEEFTLLDRAQRTLQGSRNADLLIQTALLRLRRIASA
jgi:hypothetical protein